MPQHLKVNPILGTDSYKMTHWWQYPPDSLFVYSHLMSRGGFFQHTLFNGLQGILKQHFTGVVFTKEDIEYAAKKCAAHFGNDKVFNYKGWTRLLEKHGGKLPLKIRAVPEGTVVPVKNCLMTIENTDSEFPWLTNWAETRLLRIWYPITVGTLSFEIKQAIGADLVRTGTPELLPFKLQDFGSRGVTCEEQAAIGGFSHLINFKGTDTFGETVAYAEQFYGTDEMPGFSIPAMEHSTVTSWGEEHEADAYRNMLDKSPDGLVACVIDSYDTHNAVAEIFGKHLRDVVLRRNGTVILRPDSGDPVPVLEDVFNAAAEKFGFEANAKGYKVLAPQVRAIQGDGVNYQNILRINSALTRAGWSMDNWGYGMGGALLQQLNRDTQRFAIKCSAINRAGEWKEVHKNPKTDITKASIGGRMQLVDKGDGDFVTIVSNEEMGYGNVLQTVFLDGELKVETTLAEIRETAAKYDRYEEMGRA